MAPSRGAIFSFSDRFKTRKRSFMAASPLGKRPRALTARRSLASGAPVRLAAQTIRRTSLGKAKKGTASARARRRLWPVTSCLQPPSPSSKAGGAFPVAAGFRFLQEVKSRPWRRRSTTQAFGSTMDNPT